MEIHLNSKTWKKTLGAEGKEEMQAHVDTLRNSFVKTREKVSQLANEIHRILPEYTVHDITHIDALWEMADIILPEDFELNPMEGYVLGIAFLIHDLGMALAAYAGGIEEIEKKDIWRDTVAAEFKRKYGKSIAAEDWAAVDEEIKKLALENTLRKLHAEQAEKLAVMEWELEGKREYLIDDTELREAYGKIIGEIAYSHWWGTEQVKKEFLHTRLGAAGKFPNDWTVDALKLACILRIADAMHIDDKRAPVFLMKLRRPEKISRLHWIFQNKLYQPMVEKERVKYTSKSAFGHDEIEAWWTCYDTLQMIDEELKSVETLLIETGYKKFAASGVCGIASTEELAKYIQADGWVPVDTSIRVGDVGRLVANLGGQQLYGDNRIVPMRELVQNGSDAIRARRLLEEDEEYVGNITVSFYEKEGAQFVAFEDNGIGMSKRVLTGPFLDFGQSFWNTPLMYDELPGLSAKGFSSTGQYGIGFYSVFMWSSEVTVITRRYDAAREDTFVLEFKMGTESRPILRKAEKGEQIKNGGTKVIIKTSFDIRKMLEEHTMPEGTLRDELAAMYPCMDCNLWLKDGEKAKEKVVAANDWLTIEPIELIKRLAGPKIYERYEAEEKQLLERTAPNMRLLEKDGVVYGRAFVCKEMGRFLLNSIGRAVVGGFSTSAVLGIGGVLTSKSVQASREKGIPLVDKEILQEWGKEQLQMVQDMGLDRDLQAGFAASFSCLNIRPEGLCIARTGKGFLNCEEIAEYVAKNSAEEFLVASAIGIRVGRDSYPIRLHENVFLYDEGHMHALFPGVNSLWPYQDREEWEEKGMILEDMIVQAIFAAWNQDPAKKDRQKVREEDLTEVIGEQDGEKIEGEFVTKVSMLPLE